MHKIQETTASSNCPIAVYQMGKVGSETILKSLNLLGVPNSIYHVHVMHSKNLKKSEDHLTAKNLPLTLQLEQSKELRKYLVSQELPYLNVITPVREPIGQQISAFFQNLDRIFTEFLDADGNCIEEKTRRYLENQVLEGRLPALRWMDDEFKPALGINVYEYEFNKTSGYQILTKDNMTVLLLRLESSDVWSRAISEALNLPDDLEIVTTNTGSNKKHGEAYQKILRQLKFPRPRLQEIYSSTYCRHFYPQDMLERFIDKWVL